MSDDEIRERIVTIARKLNYFVYLVDSGRGRGSQAEYAISDLKRSLNYLYDPFRLSEGDSIARHIR